ncbi:MAG: hypothetical protein K0R18_382 [Bacillales bacterium]|jgi:hypothetical protein|nr:hypothetical protein [Bacillales bacterium]
MKNVSIETNYNVLKEIGKLFELKVNGIKAAILIDQINERIDEMNSQPKAKGGKWFENETPAFNENDLVIVKSGWATGRQALIVKPSAKKNAFKAQLFNPKSGTPQGTLVGLDEVDIELYVPQFPVLAQTPEVI